jgi:HEPN domain-containing protein
MRLEILRFWEQAQEDLETARYNSAGGKFYAAAFFCQQAVEKALKALYMHQTREPPPSTHSLVVLGRLVDAAITSAQATWI